MHCDTVHVKCAGCDKVQEVCEGGAYIYSGYVCYTGHLNRAVKCREVIVSTSNVSYCLGQVSYFLMECISPGAL